MKSLGHIFVCSFFVLASCSLEQLGIYGVNVSSNTMFKRAFVNETWTATQTDPFWKTYLSGFEVGVGFDGCRVKLQRVKAQPHATEELVDMGEILDAVMKRLPKWSTA